MTHANQADAISRSGQRPAPAIEALVEAWTRASNAHGMRAPAALVEADVDFVTVAGRWLDGSKFFQLSESVVNALNAVGIRTRRRPIERGAFNAARREKRLRGLFMAVSGNSGNAARRVRSARDNLGDSDGDERGSIGLR